MTELPWFKENLDQWLNLIMSQQAPHAILLNGSNGLGKFKLAQQMAHIALCENLSESGACQKCSACNLYKAENHPDLTLVTAEKAVIKVDQIRQISQNVNLGTTRNQYRVILIDNAEKMNSASANALLKTLEEPPVKVVIILTTGEIGRLLPTIKSRCVKINIPIPQFNISYDWLNNKSDNSKDEKLLSLTLANGSPCTALKMLQNGTVNEIKEMLDELSLLSHNSIEITAVAKRWRDKELELNFPFLATYFLALVKAENAIFMGENILDIHAYDYSHVRNLDQKLITFIEKLFLSIKRNHTPLKKELLIEELLLSWKTNFKLK